MESIQEDETNYAKYLYVKGFLPAQSIAPAEEPISIYTKILNIPQAYAVLDA